MTNAVNEVQSANNIPTNTVTSTDYLNNKEEAVNSLSSPSSVDSLQAGESTTIVQTQELETQELQTTNTLSSLVQNMRSYNIK